MSNKKYAVLSLSGGLDSSTLLLHLLKEGYDVTCLSIWYGQRHKIELERAKELVQYLNIESQNRKKLNPISRFPKPEWNQIKHFPIEINGLENVLVSGLVDNDSMELKTGHYAHENALTSVVPNRNALLASIAYGAALSQVKKTEEKCLIALGTHMGDFDNDKKQGIYPDCSEEFREALEHAFKIGNWDSEKVDYYAPYNTTDKTGVLKDGIDNCKLLNLDYKEIYKRTNTSYAPIKVGNIWYSDYKTGSSVERIVSFIKLNLEDPLQYVEDDGNFVSWEFVKNHALKLEEEFLKI